MDEDLVFPLPTGFLLLTGGFFILRIPGLVRRFLSSWFKITPQKNGGLREFPHCIGHRGARSESVLENSMYAFQYALEQGAWGLELDTQSSLDGELIVLHDSTLDRTCQGSGVVSKMNGTEIREILLKNGENIPLLREVLSTWGSRIHINIEIKKEPSTDRTRQSAESVCRVLEEISPPIENITISSFSPLALYYVRRFAPRWARSQLIADPKTSLVTGLRGFLLGTWAFAIAWEAKGMVWEKSILFRRPGLATLASRLGFNLWIYTSNSPEEWKLARTIGIHGVITDFPKEYLENAKENFS